MGDLQEPDLPGPLSERDKLVARRVSMLECVPGRAVKGRRESVVVVTLGHPDASIDQIALTVSDAKLLLYRIAVAIGRERLPLGPATESKILRRWVVPHSVGRAELNVEGEGDRYLEQLKQELPELHEYLSARFDALRRILHRAGRGAAKPETLMKTVKRLVLVALDAARLGT
jgi:hypothetical protein